MPTWVPWETHLGVSYAFIGDIAIKFDHSNRFEYTIRHKDKNTGKITILHTAWKWTYEEAWNEMIEKARLCGIII